MLQGSTPVTRELSLSLGSVSDRFHPDMSTGSMLRRGITKATLSQFLRHSLEINKNRIWMLSLSLIKLSYYPSTSFLSGPNQLNSWKMNENVTIFENIYTYIRVFPFSFFTSFRSFTSLMSILRKKKSISRVWLCFRFIATEYKGVWVKLSIRICCPLLTEKVHTVSIGVVEDSA